jgi:Origin of replication binding protein
MSNLDQAPQFSSTALTALAAWGISPATARQFCLHYDGRNAFRYPSAEGHRHRLLFINRLASGAKNIWDKQTAHLPMPALYNTVRLISELAYLTNGEKSTLALHTAGILNAVNTFSEGSRIREAIQVLLEQAVRRVWFAPDCDPHGLRTAFHWLELGSALGLEIQLYDLRLYLEERYNFTPAQYEKWDLRDLWLLVNQDPHAFQSSLAEMPLLDFSRYPTEMASIYPPRQSQPAPDFKKSSQPASSDIDWAAAYQAWVNGEVIPSLDKVSPPPQRGKHRFCPNPHHHDNKPSFRISEKGIPQCSCGIQTENKPWQRVAEWVGAKSWADYKTALLAEHKKIKATTALKSKKKDNFAEIIRQLEPCSAATFTVNEYMDVRYLSPDTLTAPTLLIKSPIGTGKTEVLKELIKRYQRCLIIVHRQALARAIAERLGLPCYSDLSPQELVNVNQVVICLNSLPKLVGNSPLAAYDLIAIDEFTQVIEHLDGDTFRGHEALNSYKVLCSLLPRAKQVIALDADMNDLARPWLTKLRGEVWAIENIYRLLRGKLTLYHKRDRLVKQALKAAASGNIAIACGLERSESLRILFAKAIGKDNVRVVNRKNSLSQDTQNFLSNINLSPLPRVLIYTPSLGSGFDITQKVSAVFGLFEGNWFTATEVLQMLGRCRNTQETHVYFPAVTEGQRLEDALKLFELDLAAANMTADEGDFDANGVFVTSQTQQELSRLLATFAAESNRSKNNLLAHFITLARESGYTIRLNETGSKAIRKALKKASEEYRAADKQLVLTATPIDDVELDLCKAADALTPEVWAGNDRYHIEKTVGDSITPVIYDDFYPKARRDALKVFTNLRRHPQHLQAQDRAEAAVETLLSKRQHHAPRARLVKDLLQTIFAIEDVNTLRQGTDLILASDLCRRMRTWLDQHEAEVPLYFERRKERSNDPLAVLRWILARIGLSLERKRVRHGEDLTYVYWIEGDLTQIWFAYSDTRLASLHETAALPPACSHASTIDTQPNCQGENSSLPPACSHSDTIVIQPDCRNGNNNPPSSRTPHLPVPSEPPPDPPMVAPPAACSHSDTIVIQPNPRTGNNAPTNILYLPPRPPDDEPPDLPMAA